MIVRLSSFIHKQKNTEEPYHHHQQQHHIMQNLFNTSKDNYLNLELLQEDSFTDLEFDVIWDNQVLEVMDKFPGFDLREACINPYSQPPHILKAKEVILWNPSYQRVIISSEVLDRNGEITVQTEDRSFEGVELEELLWVEHFSKSSPITHNIRSCTVNAKDSERFTGVRRKDIHKEKAIWVI